jgi:hypothetical protein
VRARPLVALLALAAWLGAALLVVLVVAPAAFAVAPEPRIAGDLVGRVLGPLHWTGAAAGIVAFASLRGPVAARVLAAALVLFCLVSELGITPRIAELRALSIGPDADPALRARFGQLHGASVALLSASVLASTAAAFLASRALVGETPRR